MKKACKITGKIFLGLLILLALFLLIVMIYNQIMIKKEKELLKEHIGQMVEIDGNEMCVYTEGNGDHTLVFLSGSGTVSPIYDFKTLYSRLSGDYRIVVIEKFGYGFSDVVDTDRDFNTILRQDRDALSKLGIEGPFVLCPHSMSGLEAIMWVQNYPDEVEAIVGLDMAMPRHYDEFDLEGTLKYEKLAAAAREIGLVRLFYTDSAIPGTLTKEEKSLYRALAARKVVNIDVQYEGEAIPAACSEIDSRPIPDIPTLLFVSDGKETRVSNWISAQYDYAAGLINAEVTELDCGHYVHDFEYERIGMEMKEFIEKSFMITKRTY